MPYIGTCFRFYTQMRVQKKAFAIIEFIVTSHNRVLFSFWYIWLVCAEIKCTTVHVALPKWPINQLKPVKQSIQRVLRAYCLKMYIVWAQVRSEGARPSEKVQQSKKMAVAD